jgi:hypothetical protein
MKKTMYSAAIILMSVMLTVACDSSSEKVDTAEKNVEVAKDELVIANEEYLVEMEAYRITAAERFVQNEKATADFNARVAKDKTQAKADYQERIKALDAKNSDLKKRLDEYKANSKDGWESFKAEFNAEMERIGDEINSLTSDNQDAHKK